MGVHELLQTMRVRYVEEEEVDRLDPKHMSFFNVNSDVDMKRARELAKREGRC
jgi:molybdopterin-guanine dinucleotide biosynthesis protein A